MFVLVLLWSGIYSGSCTGTQETNVFLSGLNLGGFQKVTLIAPQVASEASNVLMVRNWTLVWDAIRSTLVHLHPASVGEPGRTTTAPALVRDRLNMTREGKLQCKVCLHPHLEQGGMPPVERWHQSLFSSLTDGS